MDGFVQHCKRAMCRGDSDDGGDENRMINQEYEEYFPARRCRRKEAPAYFQLFAR